MTKLHSTDAFDNDETINSNSTWYLTQNLAPCGTDGRLLLRINGRTDVPTDGRTFPPLGLMLLGRLKGVDLNMLLHFTNYYFVISTTVNLKEA